MDVNLMGQDGLGHNQEPNSDSQIFTRSKP
jgi:hypothetical protein